MQLLTSRQIRKQQARVEAGFGSHPQGLSLMSHRLHSLPKQHHQLGEQVFEGAWGAHFKPSQGSTGVRHGSSGSSGVVPRGWSSYSAH